MPAPLIRKYSLTLLVLTPYAGQMPRREKRLAAVRIVAVISAIVLLTDGISEYVVDHGLRHTSLTIKESLKSLLLIAVSAPLIYVCVIRPYITARDRAEAAIQNMARHDPLTGLPNRTLLRDRLKVALARARRVQSRVGVLFVDLDGFKQVNDRYSHHAGDEFLRTVAARMRTCIREGDTVARYGGDEFVVILSDLSDNAQTQVAARRIIEVVEDVARTGDLRLRVSASIGVSLFPDHGDDVESLLSRSDKAMYEVKKAGKQGWRIAQAGGDTESGNPPASAVVNAGAG